MAKQSVFSRAELNEYAERAEQARKMRRQAPPVDVRGALQIPQKQMLAMMAESEGGVDKKMHRLFVGKDEVSRYSYLGYKVSEKDETVMTFGETVMMEIPMDLYRASLDESVARSKAMLGESVSRDAATANATATSTGEQTTIREVQGSDLAAAALEASRME